MGLSFSYGKDGWNGKPETRRDRVSEALGEGIGEAVSNARHQAYRLSDRRARKIRDAAEGMEPAPGGRTPSRTQLTRAEKRQADKVLRDGKPKREKKR